MKKDTGKKTMLKEIKGYIGSSLRDVKEELRSEIEDGKRHTGVLVESLRSEVKLVFEQYGTVIRKLEDHDLRFDKIDLELKGMKTALFDNSHRLDDHKTRIRKLEIRG